MHSAEVGYVCVHVRGCLSFRRHARRRARTPQPGKAENTWQSDETFAIPRMGMDVAWTGCVIHGWAWMDVDSSSNNPLHVAVCRIALKECTLNSFVLQSVIYHSTLYISTVGRYGIWASLTQHTAFLRDTATREYGRIACERRERERERACENR
jgi:hypothetical protein